MAKFKVTARTYRDGRLYEPGEQFVCQDEDEQIDKHGLSMALKPADEDTEKLVDAAKKRKAKLDRQGLPISGGESSQLRKENEDLRQQIKAIHAALAAKAEAK